MAVETGKKAPAFTLRDAAGAKVSLGDYAGRTIVLYFYPKDDTPGCTKEACGFRDLHEAFAQLGVEVIGISPDGPDAHRDFAAKHGLGFTLLCDPDHRVMEKYGAWGEKVLYGKKKIGVIRSTTLIGPDGRVLRHWKKVPKAEDHPRQVLEFLRPQR